MPKPMFDPINKIWHGPKLPPLYNPDQNLGQLILKVLQQTPDSVTQISADTDVSVTCQQMNDRSIKIAKYLTKCGMKEGDLIGFVTGNTENLAPIVFACFALGLPVNPLSPIMNEKDIVQMFSTTKPKIIFCDAENLKVVQNAVNELKSEAQIFTVMDKVDGYECVTAILREMEGDFVEDFEFPNIDSNSTAAILCSSGSTGFPKGICKSHKQVISSILFYWNKPRTKSVTFFQISPIFWISGFNILVFAALFRAVRVITSKPFDLTSIINKYKVTDVMTPPFALVNLLQIKDLKPFETVEYWIIGGMTAAPSLCEKFESFVPNGIITNAYGCTEVGILTINNSGKNYGSPGMVLDNVDLKIIDDNGRPVDANRQGEICCKISVQFSGYFADPVKTEEAFEGEWFKTGDIGYFDDDGYFYIVDRKKEMLKYKSYQVTSTEIEGIINEIEGVTSSCVVGVPEQNTGNDIIHAFVMLDKVSNLSDDFILNYVNEKVIDPKRIRGGVHIVDSFPLGMTGKVDRKKVREMAQKIKRI